MGLGSRPRARVTLTLKKRQPARAEHAARHSTLDRTGVLSGCTGLPGWG